MENKKLGIQTKSRFKKDRIFVFVLSLTAAGLFYQTIMLILNMVSGAWTMAMAWLYLIINIIAIYAVLTLLNNNRKKQRIARMADKENKVLYNEP